MSKLKKIREKNNLTQDELATQSGISVRTIQRIEAGITPKGHTLKALSKALKIDETILKKEAEETIEKPSTASLQISKIKIINLISILFFIPPFNIIAPLLLTYLLKQKNALTKGIISIQILWTIIAPVLFMLSAFAKNWFNLGNKFTLLIMVFLVITNLFIVLRNAAALDQKGKLYFKLNFDFI
ncbi:Helix-turn-helix [Flavobacterium sp. 9AF]|uniref:helix-turn-helix domain-containing protein n=1 Tax=Flavobacterium sp. 9AF TaxID=2653142 RepID=UPI0012EF9A57|nr:helix-turn-helix transcriptional regulator [Flavobacterium sp. 9AF]VXB59580.1 Helix-turn-helix [Flavobacterium sp. 9AF]